jgi:hypothetical protein
MSNWNERNNFEPGAAAIGNRNVSSKIDLFVQKGSGAGKIFSDFSGGGEDFRFSSKYRV